MADFMQWLWALGVLLVGIAIGAMLVRDMYLGLMKAQTKWLMERMDTYHRRIQVLEVFATEVDPKRFQRLQEQLHPTDCKFVDCTFTDCQFRNAPTVERKV